MADKVKQPVVQMTMLHRQLGQVMREVYQGNEHVVVEKGGLPMVVMMSMREYEDPQDASRSVRVVECEDRAEVDAVEDEDEQGAQPGQHAAGRCRESDAEVVRHHPAREERHLDRGDVHVLITPAQAIPGLLRSGDHLRGDEATGELGVVPHAGVCHEGRNEQKTRGDGDKVAVATEGSRETAS